MQAMVLKGVVNITENNAPLELVDIPIPVPKKHELLVKVGACGVCHTELDEIEGRTPPSKFPIIPGHQIVGRVEGKGASAKKFREGDRIGIAWIFSACGTCAFCRAGNENLCGEFRATGRDADGGYAEYTVVAEEYAYRVPEVFSDTEAAPLLCAGAIGYRSLRLTRIRDGDAVGLTGFGASGHLVLKLIQHEYPNSRVFVFSRTEQERLFAKQLGAMWAGGTDEASPEKLHGIIDTTPAWTPVVMAMRNLVSGGRLVINAIRKENRDKDTLLQLDYPRDLWMEKEIKSVANITRRDVMEFLQRAAEIPLRPEIEEFGLADANAALRELKQKKIRGAKVLKIG